MTLRERIMEAMVNKTKLGINTSSADLTAVMDAIPRCKTCKHHTYSKLHDSHDCHWPALPQDDHGMHLLMRTTADGFCDEHSAYREPTDV